MAALTAIRVTSSDFRRRKHYAHKKGLRYAIWINLPITVDAQTLAQLAAEAEAAGWDFNIVMEGETPGDDPQPLISFSHSPSQG